MGSSLYVLVADSAMLEEMAVSGGFDELMSAGVDFDQLGWAVVALAVGEVGIVGFDDRGVSRAGLGVPVMSAGGVARLADLLVADRGVLEERFDAGAFGEQFGPLPEPDERDAVVDMALEFGELVTAAREPGQHLVWFMS